MRKSAYIFSSGFLLLIILTQGLQAQSDMRSLRIDSLLQIMTLEEKIGQLCLLNAVTKDVSIRDEIRKGKLGGILNETNPDTLRELQRIARDESRLGIQLLTARDVIHGYQTIFPIPLALAATFDTALVARTAMVAAQEAKAAGINWTFSPMLDISRDPRWGRVAEGFGEDTYLTSLMGVSMVKGYQQEQQGMITGIASCVKHFAGYGAAEGGRDYNSVELSELSLRTSYLPPFQASLDAGSPAVMAGFHDLNGIPATGNTDLLTEILRKEWRFEGLVVSDWESVPQLQTHGLAVNQKEAAAHAFLAGCDMEMASTSYQTYLADLIHAGTISMPQLNQAVARVLYLKFKLGLLPGQILPQEPVHIRLQADSFRDLALEAALKSFVLLKNDHQLLPLSSNTKNVLIVGPMADAPHDQLGTWSPDGHKDETITPVDYLQSAENLSFEWKYIPGLRNSRDKSTESFKSLVKAAKTADVILCIVGEEAILSGESHSRADLHLPGAQEEMLRALRETGKPIVAVILAGRPLVLSAVLDQVDALLYAWAPGTMGGPAIIRMLLGEKQPSGKLPITFPAHEGQIPLYYNHRNTGKPAFTVLSDLSSIPEEAPQFSIGNTSQYLDEGFEPLFPFGFGLNYSTSSLSDLVLSSSICLAGDSVQVAITITNTGHYEMEETVQLYLKDVVAAIASPVKELKDFAKVFLKPGERKKVVFYLNEDDFKYMHPNLQHFADEGYFNLMIGTSSQTSLETGVYFKPLVQETDSQGDNINLKTQLIENEKIPIIKTENNH